MEVAITADVHLTDYDSHPERYNALEDILETITKKNSRALIVAGDLFDASSNNYADFDQLASKYSEIQFHIIPGNHDETLKEENIPSENIHIYSAPSFVPFEGQDEQSFLFLPYQTDKTMGEAIAEMQDELTDNWILVGHGDWMSGVGTTNAYEQGVYMPLTRRDIDLFNPVYAFLGHIHKPMKETHFCYPGSPCGMDITETGRRRFVIYDTYNRKIASYQVNTDIIYHSETIVLLPLEDEETHLRDRFTEIKESWNLTEREKEKTHIRIKIRGFTKNKRQVKSIAAEELEDFKFYNDEGIDLSELFMSDSYEREEIAQQVKQHIAELDWSAKHNEPAKDDILLYALRTIYGEDLWQ